MVEALDRAFRWQRMLDEGVCGTMEEPAKREKVIRGYMSRVLRLTLLAPEFIESILEGGTRRDASGGSAGWVSCGGVPATGGRFQLAHSASVDGGRRAFFHRP
jgi:hypothetical protein